MAPLKNLLGNMTGRRGRSLANMDPTMMMMAAQLINNSAPSTQRRSLMQGMPEAMMQGQQMDRQNKEYERQQAEHERTQNYRNAVKAALDKKGSMAKTPVPNPNYQPQVEGGQQLNSLMQPRTGLEQSLMDAQTSKQTPYDWRGDLAKAEAEFGTTQNAVTRALAAPKSIPIETNAAGYKVYNQPGTAIHGTRAFPGAEKPPTELSEAQRTKNASIDEGRYYMDRHWETHSPDDAEFRLDSQRDDNFSNMARLARTRKYGEDPGHREYLSRLDPNIYDPEQYQESLTEHQLGLGGKERDDEIKSLAGDLLRNLNPDDLGKAGGGLESFGVSRREFKAALEALGTPEETIDFIMDKI